MLPVCFLFLQCSPVAELAAVENRRGGEREVLAGRAPNPLVACSWSRVHCRLVVSAPLSVQGIVKYRGTVNNGKFQCSL